MGSIQLSWADEMNNWIVIVIKVNSMHAKVVVLIHEVHGMEVFT
jgi:hypothetical protein